MQQIIHASVVNAKPPISHLQCFFIIMMVTANNQQLKRNTQQDEDGFSDPGQYIHGKDLFEIVALGPRDLLLERWSEKTERPLWQYSRQADTLPIL